MDHTAHHIGFIDNTTIQLRLELGSIIDSVQTTDVPEGLTLGEDGFVWFDGGWYGRVSGVNGEYFQRFDTYLPSDIDPLFDWDWTDPDGVIPADDITLWSVTVNGEAATLTGLSRKANILQSAETTLYEFDYRTAQNVFLELETPLEVGDVVEISFNDPSFESLTADFAPATTLSEAIHVNLMGHDPDDPVKKAFLSSWNGWSVAGEGASVAQVYETGPGFEVIDAATGAVIATAQATMVQAADEPNNFWNNFNRTDVWQMDFSEVDAPGEYYIAVDGVGISQTFTIHNDHWQEIFENSFSGFYHQRSGIALEEAYTDYTRPASLMPGEELTVLRTDVRITETSEGIAEGSAEKPFDRFPNETTGETVEAWGGWHDAGDWDRRTQHLEAARALIELYEMQPDWASDDGLNIPEQGDGIPDILQEAIWGIEVFKRLQTEDAGIPGGIEQGGYRPFGSGSWSEGTEIYAYAPDVWSSWEYAASAAKVAHNLAAFDAQAAADWLQSARDAMAYAEANWETELTAPHPRDITSRNIAALELYRATGETAYHDVFEASSVYTTGDISDVTWNAHQFEAAFLYATMGDLALNAEIRETGVADITGEVNLLRDLGSRSAFGNLYNPYAPYGWGNTAPQPNHSQDVVVRLHHLTDDAELFDIIQADVQYALGANPLNMTYTTGLDAPRTPEEVLNIDAETLGYGPPPGLTLYGDYHIHDYGWQFYHDQMFADQWPNVWQAPVHESWQGHSVYVPVTEYTVQQGILDMTYVTGYLAALADEGGVRVLSEEADRLVTEAAEPITVDASGGEDFVLGGFGAGVLIGGEGSDNLIGRGGDDTLAGGAGNDLLEGGGGADHFVMSLADFGGFSVDTIADFTLGTDLVILDGGTASLTSIGGDTALSFGSGFVRLSGVAAGSAALDDIVAMGDAPVLPSASAGPLTLTEMDDRLVLGGGTAREIVAGGGDDFVIGSGTLLGGDGSDVLTGRAEADRLDGGAGNDVLTGGGGADVFVFGAEASFTVDTVADFTIGVDLVEVTPDADVSVIALNGAAALSLGASLMVLSGLSETEVSGALDDIMNVA